MSAPQKGRSTPRATLDKHGVTVAAALGAVTIATDRAVAARIVAAIDRCYGPATPADACYQRATFDTPEHILRAVRMLFDDALAHVERAEDEGSPSTTREAIAYHEAGHACVAGLLGHHIEQASIRPDGRWSGVVWQQAPAGKDPRVAAIDYAKVALAGPLAEGLYTHTNAWASVSADADRETVSAYLSALLGEAVPLSAHTEILAHDTRALLAANYGGVVAVATALLEHETLDHAAVERAFARGMGKSA